MLNKLRGMINKISENIDYEEAVNHEIDSIFDGPDSRFEGSVEEEMVQILDVFRTTKLPLDTYYYSGKHKQFMLSSHVFDRKELADVFVKDLKEVFPQAQIEIIEDRERRYFIHLNPKTITECEFERFERLYKAKLFSVPKEFYDNKCRAEVKLLLDDLKSTNVPMDIFYLNYEDNVYYIVSHVFHSRERVEAYADCFKALFGSKCASILEDISGRFFLHINPSAILKDAFQKFFEQHQVKLFDEIPEKDLVEANFSHNLDHGKFILSSLRYTTYPMDCVFYCRRTDCFYLGSHVFTSKEKAKNYMECFQQHFEPDAVTITSDIQERWYVFLDPARLNKERFDMFIKVHATKIFD